MNNQDEGQMAAALQSAQQAQSGGALAKLAPTLWGIVGSFGRARAKHVAELIYWLTYNDAALTTPADQSARIAELEAELENLRGLAINAASAFDDPHTSTAGLMRALYALRDAALQSAQQAPAVKCLHLNRISDGVRTDCTDCGASLEDKPSAQQAPAGEEVAAAHKRLKGDRYTADQAGYKQRMADIDVLYTADQSARIAELEKQVALLRQSWHTAIDIAREGADTLDRVAEERDEAHRQLVGAQATLARIKEAMLAGKLNTLHNLACADHKTSALASAIEQAKAEARERSAKIADRHSTCLNDTANVIAAAIRTLPDTPQAEQKPVACQWSVESNDYSGDVWNSACGMSWSFIEGGPAENDVKYCQGCGKPVEIQQGKD